MAQIVNSPEKVTAVADYSIFGSVKTNVTFKSSVCVSSIILFGGRLTASSSSRTCSGAAALSHALLWYVNRRLLLTAFTTLDNVGLPVLQPGTNTIMSHEEKNQALYSVATHSLPTWYEPIPDILYEISYPVLLLLLTSPLILVILSITYRGWHAYLLTWKNLQIIKWLISIRSCTGLAENLWADSTKFRQIWELYSVWN